MGQYMVFVVVQAFDFLGLVRFVGVREGEQQFFGLFVRATSEAAGARCGRSGVDQLGRTVHALI